MSDLSNSSSDAVGFVGHMFNFNAQTKEEMLNIVQYAILAIIPVVVLNKTIQKLVPDVDDEKGNIEIAIEVIIQIIVMFLGIFFIHRLITYVPTYSERKYEIFSITNIVLVILVITLSLQTRLGEKVSILAERVMALWTGEVDKKKKKKNVKTSQPISQSQPQQPQSQYPGSTSIGALPAVNYDAMYQQQPTPLVDASEPFEPMAANSGGGSGFGTF